jgi:hypothetical protein
VILYALIAVLVWPAGRMRARWPNLLWTALWGSFCYYLLLPDNRAPGTIAGFFQATDGQPGWIVAIMNGMATLAGRSDAIISVILVAACVLVAVGVWIRPATRAALVLAVVIALVIWLAEGFGGIFTGEGTDPNTGPLLVLLAACYWPSRQAPAIDRGTSVPAQPAVMTTAPE